MTDIRPPAAPSPEPGTGSAGSVCPTTEELAAYASGGLDRESRERIEDHVSRCNDCHFILRETALFEAEIAGQEAVAATPAQPAARTRRLTFLLPLAAVLVVGLASAVLWMQSHSSDPRRYAQSIAPLVEAVGPRRFLAARLAGGFQAGPLLGRRGSGAPGTSEQWPLFAAAEKIRAANAQRPSPEGEHALAAAHLLVGETDLAVQSLEALVRDSPRDAALRNDLAAAYLTRALDGRNDDFAKAFDSASKAVELDPKLAEGWFNRALAADALHRVSEAEESRRHLRELEGASGWGDR